MKTIKTAILALVLGVAAAAGQSLKAESLKAEAQTTPAGLFSLQPSGFQAFPLPLLLAQAQTPVTPVAPGTQAADTPAPAATPWYLRGELWLALISAALATTTIWQNKEKQRHQKISETLVVGIEAASKIPEIQAAEKKLKAKIQEKATAAGIEPALNKLVQILTP